jgi:hypothetical protein
MRDRVLISSLNVQNPIISNVENVLSCRSDSGWIGGRDYAMNIFFDILLKKLLHRSILLYNADMEKLTWRCD